MSYDENSQLRKLKVRLGIKSGDKDALLLDYLEDARLTINTIRRYKGNLGLEEKYYGLQLRMAVCAYNKIGAEGETSHNENGISRSYDGGNDYPKSMLREIVPLVR